MTLSPIVPSSDPKRDTLLSTALGGMEKKSGKLLASAFQQDRAL